MNPTPFVKSAGGKRRLLPEILKILGPRIDATKPGATYHEPFVGGGALFFAVYNREIGNIRLADGNLALIATYKVIRDDVDLLIARMRQHGFHNAQSTFAKVRSYFNLDLANPNEQHALGLAVRFIYLNKTCFNGLWRVNQSGAFNVPFGRYTNPTICDAENLRACSKALQGVKLYAKDFSSTPVRPGDVVYADSPYIPVNATSNFVGYTKEGFGMADHIRLRDKAKEWKKLGAFVLLSNSDTPVTRELYKGWRLKEVQAARSVNSNGGKRGKVGELLIY